jgi:hypothetical protein
LEINLENNRNNGISTLDFEIALSIIKESSKIESLSLNINIIGLKIKEKGIYALMNLLT